MKYGNLKKSKRIISLEEIPVEQTFCHKQIFRLGTKIPQKMPIEKVEPSKIIQYIKNAFNNLFEVAINLDLIGKFISSISSFQVPEEYVIYYCKKKIDNDIVEEIQNIYYKNRKIFTESKKQKKIKKNKNESTILVFKITIEEKSIKEKYKKWLKKISEEKIDEIKGENCSEDSNDSKIDSGILSSKEEEDEEEENEEENEEEEDPDDDEMNEIKEEEPIEKTGGKMEEEGFNDKEVDEKKENLIVKSNIITQKAKNDDIDMAYEDESLKNVEINTNKIDDEDYEEEEEREEEEKENDSNMDVEKEQNDNDNIKITELSREEYKALIKKFNPIIK